VAIVAKLNGEVNASLADPKLRARFAALRNTALGLSPVDYASRWAATGPNAFAKPAASQIRRVCKIALRGLAACATARGAILRTR
jgi:hypothetical protein